MPSALTDQPRTSGQRAALRRTILAPFGTGCTARSTGVCVALGASLVLASGQFEIHAGPESIVINEILYHPDPDNLGGEFIELRNDGDTSVDLSGWTLREAVDFEFPAGTVIEPRAHLVVARLPEDARAFYGVQGILGPYEGRLDNAGDLVVLAAATGRQIDAVQYDDELPWPPEADGGGPSLELLDPASDNSDGASWGIGVPYSPGAATAPAEPDGGDVAITEIMYKPLRSEPRMKFDAVNQGPYTEIDDDEFGEYVEIYNRSEALVDLSEWVFSEGIDFAFAEGTTLAPGAYLVVAAVPDMLKARHGISNVVGPYSGRLRDGGERLTLRDHHSAIVDTVRFADGDPWPTAPDAKGVSLEVVDPLADNSGAANWRSSEDELPAPALVLAAGDDGANDDWVMVSAAGQARNEDLLLSVFIGGTGEWLVDEIEMRPADAGVGEDSIVPNGTFDAGDDGWTKRGNHEGTFWTTEDFKKGGGAEHLVSTGTGSNSSSLRVRFSGLTVGTTYRLTAWAKYVSGFPVLFIRTLGTDINASVSKSSFVLSADWSDTLNPNGLWEYRDGAGELIEGRSAAWRAEELGAGQSAWANGDAELTGWAKSTGDAPALDFPAGTVAAHGPAQLWWRSPGLGQVTIRGGAFLPRRVPGNHQQWAIALNDEALTSGVLIPEQVEFDSSHPSPFASGSGGVGALTVTVKEDDTIRFLIEALPDHESGFVGLDAGVKFRAGIEPKPPISGAIGGASPGRVNSVHDTDLPPHVSELGHTPFQPGSTDDVTVTARVESAAPLRSVELHLEVLRGDIRETADLLSMFDDGAHNDGAAGDGTFGARVAALSSQTLVHYRVRAEDREGRVTVFPYASDPARSRAYFHYDGEIDTRQTLFFLFMTPENLSRLRSDPRSDEYLECSVVIDDRRPGKEQGPIAYPHIGARHRGRRSRTDPRHQWKLKFNRSQLYDDNRTLDTMLSVPLRQKMAFAICDHAGLDNLESDLVRLHLNGRFWENYIVFEVPNPTWAAKHGYGAGTEAYKARSVETPGQAKNSDLYRNQIVSDLDYWGVWNKKMRGLEPPGHIRELTEVLNDLPGSELLPWIDANIDLEQILTRYGIYILLNVDDFAGHNYYLLRPEGGKWTMLGYDFDSLGRGFTLSINYADGTSGSPDWQRNKFFQRVSTDPTLRRIHHLNLRRLITTVMAEDAIRRALVAEAERADGRTAGTQEINHVMGQLGSQRRSMLRVLDRQGLPAEDEVPRIDPAGRASSQPLTVTLRTPDGWAAVYTVDGSDPRLSATATVYRAAIEINRTTTLHAASIRSDGGAVDFASGDWTELAEERYEVTAAPRIFIRGDFDLNRTIDVTDVVQILRHLFQGAPAPCTLAGDANADGRLEQGDAIYLAGFLFLDGPSPPPPYPRPGTDEEGTASLGCESGL